MEPKILEEIRKDYKQEVIDFNWEPVWKQPKRYGILYPILGYIVSLLAILFEPMFQTVPEGEFFEDIKPFPCFQIDFFPHLQLFRGAVIRVTGHHYFTSLGFDKTKSEG